MEMAKEMTIWVKQTMEEAGDEQTAKCPEKASVGQELKVKFGVK